MIDSSIFGHSSENEQLAIISFHNSLNSLLIIVFGEQSFASWQTPLRIKSRFGGFTTPLKRIGIN